MKYDLNTFGFTIGIGWKPHFMCRGQRGMKYTVTLASSITFIAVIILSRSSSWLASWWQYSAFFFFFWARKPTALNHYTVHGFLCACVLLQMWFGQFCSVKKSNILQSYILLYLFQHNFFVSLILQSPFLRDLILGLISLVLWVSEILKKKQTLCLVWRFVSCQFVACVDSVISHVNLKDKMLLSTGGLDMVRVVFFRVNILVREDRVVVRLVECPNDLWPGDRELCPPRQANKTHECSNLRFDQRSPKVLYC